MPRPAKSNRASTVAHAVEELVHAITGLVDSVAGATHDAKAVGRAAKGVKVAVVGKKQRGPGKGNPKLKAALKRYWAKMKGKARRSRIARMLAGRKLGPMGATTKKAERAARARPGKGGAWASMTPEQRAERIAKMTAGREAKN